MKYKNLIGYTFKTIFQRKISDIIYTFEETYTNNANIFWYDNNNKKITISIYSKNDVLTYIKNGEWILGEKFYRKKKLKRIISE